MDKETKKKILDWISKNHEHHYEGEETLMTMCCDGEYPYVNSIELEKFISSL